MLATKLQERYTGPHAPDPPADAPVTDVPPVLNATSFVQNPRYLDPDFENLIKLLTDMDARTGRPDPSKRRRGKPETTTRKKR